MNAQRSTSTPRSPRLRSSALSAVCLCLVCLCGCQYQSTTTETTNHVYLGTPKPGDKLAAAPKAGKAAKADPSDQSDQTDRPPAIAITTTVDVSQQKPIEVSPGRELSPAREAEVRDNTIPVSAGGL